MEMEMEWSNWNNSSAWTLNLPRIPWNGNGNGKADALLQPPTIPTLFIALITGLFLVVFQYRADQARRRREAEGKGRLAPGPVPWPLVGSLPELVMYKGPAYKWVHGLLDQHGHNIACVQLGSVHVIAVDSPEIAREFLKKQDAVFASRPITMGTRYSSRGFLSVAVTPWGDQWKKMRRVVASHVLTPARLRWLQAKRTEEADNLAHYVWNQCSGGGIVDVRKAVRQYSANVIRKLVFNRRYFGSGSAKADGGPGPEEEEHVDALFQVLSLLYNFCVSDYMPSLRFLDIGGNERAMKKAIKIVDKYHVPLIEERVRERRARETETDPECNDLLDVLISVKDSHGNPLLSLEEIKAQVDDLTYAAVDNPSNAVEWALAEMLLQPEVMRKAVEEIDRVVGRERVVEEGDFGELNYVKACAKEAFRLHPVAPFNVPHMSMHDTTVAGYHIPKGSHVLLSRLGLGRNPSVWDHPLRFCPDRFLRHGASVDLLDPQLGLISFSTGRRGCLGAPLGSAMTIMLLARLLQAFHWTSSPHHTIHLSHSPHDLSLAHPLHALPTPRLPHHLYLHQSHPTP